MDKMIQIKNISKSYDSFRAVQDVTIEVDKGTIHGIIGENGSGKTTIIKCLTGIYKADEGEILVDGQPVFENVETKKKIGYVADSNQYFSSYRLSELVKFYQDIYDTFNIQKFRELNNIFNVPEKKRISQMSKGQQMRAAFMLNIAVEPQVLVLDEPTSGLDVIAKKELLDVLVSEVDNREMTVVISSHHLSELEKICDTMTVISHGKTQVQDEIINLKKNICKLQMVFKDGAPEGFYKRPEILEISNIGKIYTVVSQEDTDNVIEKYTELGAAFVEELEVSLEEFFIYSQKKG